MMNTPTTDKQAAARPATTMSKDCVPCKGDAHQWLHQLLRECGFGDWVDRCAREGVEICHKGTRLLRYHIKDRQMKLHLALDLEDEHKDILL